MKHVYALATYALATLLFVNTTSAQNTYNAVRSGNWSAPIGPNFPWDASGAPLANCVGCTINIDAGATVQLNTSVTLGAGTILDIGVGGSNMAQLLIGNSNSADFSTSFSLIMPASATPASKIQLLNTNSFVNASAAGTYDGIFQTFNNVPPTYNKQIGNAPGTIIGSDPQGLGPALYGTSLTGPITLSSSSILPITLSSFTAVLVSKGQVQLSWTTDMEVNSDHFVIERQSNGGAWTSIGNVAAQGISALPVNYSFTDDAPASGVNEYRLQSVDRDGKYTYSDIKVVRSAPATTISVFPNPASDYVNVTLGGASSGALTIQLVGQSGQLLMEKKLNNGAGTTVSLPISSYPAGNYLILVTGADGNRQVNKLLISRQ